MWREIYVILIFLLIFGGATGTIGAEIEDTKLTFFPFETELAGKYTPLADGITSMLAGRLATEEGITVVPEMLSAKERDDFTDHYPQGSQQYFQRFDVDYVGVGVLVAQGEQLEMTVVFYGANGSRLEPIKVVAFGEKDVMDAVDRLAADLVNGVSSDAGGELSVGSEKNSGLEAFRTEHPDRQFKEEILHGAAIYADEGSGSFLGREVSRRMSDLEDTALALSYNDLDGDGRQEILILQKDGLRIFQYDRGIVTQLGSYYLSPGVKVHAMNTADVDNDGVKEIYVSATEDGKFSSMVMAWTAEKGFTLIADSIRYGIRPLNIPGLGIQLAGQSRSIVDGAFLEPGVFFLKTNEELSIFQKGRKIVIPSELNLFNFVFADLDGDGSNEIVALTDDMKMIVYGPDNKVRWLSEEKYGGSQVYLGSRWNDRESHNELKYLPVQLRAVDTNGDGRTDIVSAKNEESSSVFEYFPNLRNFTVGRVVCLSWKDGGMMELWRTDNLHGYVSGFDISGVPILADKANDPDYTQELMQTRLVIGRSTGKGIENLLSFSGGEDNLIIYDFKLYRKRIASGVTN